MKNISDMMLIHSSRINGRLETTPGGEEITRYTFAKGYQSDWGSYIHDSDFGEFLQNGLAGLGGWKHEYNAVNPFAGLSMGSTDYTGVAMSTYSPGNMDAILLHLAKMKATHGEGKLYASLLTNVDFDNAFATAKNIQNKGLFLYGPFVRSGINCSRFVASTILHSTPPLITKLRLMFPFCIIPSPKRNVSTCNRNYYVVDNKSCMKINRNILAGYFKGVERI